MSPTTVLMLSSLYRRRGSAIPYRYCSALPAAALLFIVHGEGRLVVNGVRYAAKPGQLYAFAPGTAVEAAASSTDSEYYWLFIDCLNVSAKGDCQAALPETALPPPFNGIEIPISRPADIQFSLQQLEQACRQKEPGQFRTNLLFQMLLHDIVQTVQPIEHAADQTQSIEQSVAYIHDHYDQKIKLATLADLAGFTPTSFSREFKKTMGSTPVEYLNAYRIARAKQMLLEPDRSVKEVAASSGFGSEFYFSRMFKRETGYPPTLYMKRRAIRIAVAASFPFADLLHSLGIVPIVAANCHKDRTTSLQEHMQRLARCLHDLRDASPDLIICDYVNAPYEKQLKGIAPTLVVERCSDWRVIQMRIAAAIGRENEANKNMLRLDKKLKETRGYLLESFGGGTISYMRVMDKLIRIQGKGHHPLNELIYSDIGLKPGYCVHENLMHVDYSTDKYPDLGTDHLFIQQPRPQSDNGAQLASLQATPKWKSLHAVRSNQTYSTTNWVALSWSPVGRIEILDQWLQFRA